MNYLYHRVPKGIRGDILYPLNTLRDIFPDLYEEHSKKYKGREFVKEYRIPPLDCLWNDAIHMTAVHPSEVYGAMRDAGFTPDKRYFFQIDPTALDPKNTTVYLYNHKAPNEIVESDFSSFFVEKLYQYSTLSEYTKTYFKEMFEQGKQPLVFLGVPHILYKGTININSLPIIEA
jgi:hypothetical protein